jgi:hypothetical protein
LNGGCIAGASAAQQQAYAEQLLRQQYAIGVQWQQQQQQQMQMQMQMQQASMQKGVRQQGLQPGGTAAEADSLTYSRKPRAVEYQPYSLKDLGDKNWDVKKTEGYWELGRLGPEETEELQAKVQACPWAGGGAIAKSAHGPCQCCRAHSCWLDALGWYSQC